MIKAVLVVAGLSFVASTAAAETKSWTALKGKLPAGTIVVGGAGTDQTKLTACITKVMAKVDPNTKLGVKTTGKLTEYSVTGETDKLYTSWLAPDVVAISLEPKGHDALDAMMKGSAASGDLGGYLAKTSTASPGWVAFAVGNDGLKGGFGMVTLGKTVKLALKMYGMTPKDGEKGRKEMADAVKSGLERSAKQPDLKKLFQAVKVSGKDTEVSVDASVPESALPSLLPALDKVF